MPDDSTLCHLCAAPLTKGEHYIVRVDIFADPAMPDMTGEQLAALDPQAAMKLLIDEMNGMTADELQDDVHRRFEYRVCRACQQRLLVNPLGLPRKRDVGKN